MTRKGWLCAAFFLFLTMLFAAKACAQVKQIQVERICPLKYKCVEQHRAFIALTDSVIWLRSDSIPVIEYQVSQHFIHKGVKYFNIRNQKEHGLFVLNHDFATLDVNAIKDSVLFRRFEIYHFKKP